MANLSCGIVGLPNVGKSTLFNAITKNSVSAENYPFCTIDPSVGVVEIPDSRLPKLSEISKSARILPATMEFVDIAGLVQGASEGEGLGNQFLSHIRQTDAIVQVVRCFDSEDVVHVAGKVDPIGDIEVISLELILADLQMLEKALPKVEKQARANKEQKQLLELMQKVIVHLQNNQPVRSMELTPEELALLQLYPLITLKKVLYVANVSEDDLPEMNNAYVQQVRAYAEKEGSEVVPICAAIEQELAQLSDEEALAFLQDLGLSEPGLHRLIKRSFKLLGLISYLTTGEMETRAWTISEGINAQEAAGCIHTDIQKGFIRAEVVSYNDFKGWAKSREEGKARIEGKEYIVQDGDVILFRHA